MKKVLFFTNWTLSAQSICFALSNACNDLDLHIAGLPQDVVQLLKKGSFGLLILWTDHMRVPNLLKEVLGRERLSVLVIANEPTHPYALKLYRSGALGVFDPRDNLDELKRAIRETMDGKIYLNGKTLDNLLSMASVTSEPSPSRPLTKREAEIINLMLTGKNLTEIVELLNIKISTVSTLKARAYSKLGVNNLIELSQVMGNGNGGMFLPV